MVDDNPKLSTITKYSKLKASLEGQPKSLVDSYYFQEDTYEQAKNALKQSYGSEQKIATQLLEDLERHKPILKNQVESYRKFVNAANQYVQPGQGSSPYAPSAPPGGSPYPPPPNANQPPYPSQPNAPYGMPPPPMPMNMNMKIA